MQATGCELKAKETQVVKTTLTKREVEREFRQYFNAAFSIELHDLVIYVYSDLELEVEIPYGSVAEKAEIYRLIALLASRFDFSYTLSFTSLKSLQTWHESYDACLQNRIANAALLAQ